MIFPFACHAAFLRERGRWKILRDYASVFLVKQSAGRIDRVEPPDGQAEGVRVSADQPPTILVGPVRGPEHLDLIHRLLFYHVPTSSIAARRTGVSYIAFYEGASRFGGEMGVIREYARVLRVSRVLRKELPELTWAGRRGEEAPYYRFDLEAPVLLPQPITNPDRLRVAFFFPRVDQFHRAATLRDLGRGLRSKPRRLRSET